MKLLFQMMNLINLMKKRNQLFLKIKLKLICLGKTHMVLLHAGPQSSPGFMKDPAPHASVFSSLSAEPSAAPAHSRIAFASSIRCASSLSRRFSLISSASALMSPQFSLST